jgi:hypothetical protein
MLVKTSQLVVEALIEGQITEAQLIDAQQALDAGDDSLDRAILARLKTDGLDGPYSPTWTSFMTCWSRRSPRSRHSAMNQKTHHQDTKDTKLSLLCALRAFVVNPRWLTKQHFISPALIAHIGRDRVSLSPWSTRDKRSVEIQPKVLRLLQAREEKASEYRILLVPQRLDHFRDITKMIAGGGLSC